MVSGPLAEKVGSAIGAGDAVVTAWNIAKWPVLLLVVVVMFCLLYYASPNARLSGLKSVVPGAVLALVVWLVASASFAFYVANFGSYNKTYGSLGGMIVSLVWLWITDRGQGARRGAGTPGRGAYGAQAQEALPHRVPRSDQPPGRRPRPQGCDPASRPRRPGRTSQSTSNEPYAGTFLTSPLSRWKRRAVLYPARSSVGAAGTSARRIGISASSAAGSVSFR